MILSYYYLHNHIRKLVAKQKEGQRCFIPFTKAKRILLLCLEKDRETIQSDLVSWEHGHMIHIVSYAERQSTGSTEGLFISRKDLNIWGYPSVGIMQKWLSMEVDLLIDLSCGEIPALQYMVVKHPALCKVGIKNGQLDIYDFALIMTDSKDIHYLLERMLFYLQTIQFK